MFVFLVMTLLTGPAWAQPFPKEGVSLAPIFKELGVVEKEYDVIPIHSASDIVQSVEEARQSKKQTVKDDTYPIEKFAATSSGNLLAFSLDPAVLPDDKAASNDDVVLVTIAGGKPELLKVLHARNSEKWSVGDLSILDDELLRIEYIGKEEAGSDLGLGYKRVYTFVDLHRISESTASAFDLESLLPFKRVLFARAFSDTHYIVAHQNEAGVAGISMIALQSRTPKILWNFKPHQEKLARQLLHDPAADAFTKGTSEVWVRFSMYESGQWVSKLMRASSYGVSFEDEPNSRSIERIQGAPQMQLLRGDDMVAVKDLDEGGGILGRWTGNFAEAWPVLQRVGTGFLAQQQNHPYYGYSLLKDDGTVEQITAPKFRMILSKAYANALVGLGDRLPGGDVRFFYFPLIGYPKAYPIVSEFPGKRFALVRVDERTLGVVDRLRGDEVTSTLELYDTNFKIKHTERSAVTVIDYPDLRVRIAYRRPRSDRPNMQFVIKHEYSCADSLSGE